MAKIHWHHRLKCSDPDVGSVPTTRLDDLVSVLVPLGFMGSSRLFKYLENPSIRRDSDDEIPPAILELSPEESPTIEFSFEYQAEHKQRFT